MPPDRPACIQAFAMLDLTTSSFREKGSNVNEAVREHVATTLNGARKALATSAEAAAKIAADDPWGANVSLTVRSLLRCRKDATADDMSDNTRLRSKAQGKN